MPKSVVEIALEAQQAALESTISETTRILTDVITKPLSGGHEALLEKLRKPIETTVREYFSLLSASRSSQEHIRPESTPQIQVSDPRVESENDQTKVSEPVTAPGTNSPVGMTWDDFRKTYPDHTFLDLEALVEVPDKISKETLVIAGKGLERDVLKYLETQKVDLRPGETDQKVLHLLGRLSGGMFKQAVPIEGTNAWVHFGDPEQRVLAPRYICRLDKNWRKLAYVQGRPDDEEVVDRTLRAKRAKIEQAKAAKLAAKTGAKAAKEAVKTDVPASSSTSANDRLDNVLPLRRPPSEIPTPEEFIDTAFRRQRQEEPSWVKAHIEEVLRGLSAATTISEVVELTKPVYRDGFLQLFAVFADRKKGEKLSRYSTGFKLSRRSGEAIVKGSLVNGNHPLQTANDEHHRSAFVNTIYTTTLRIPTGAFFWEGYCSDATKGTASGAFKDTNIAEYDRYGAILNGESRVFNSNAEYADTCRKLMVGPPREATGSR